MPGLVLDADLRWTLIGSLAALGAADAWNAAILASNVPPPEVSMMTAPLMVHTYAHSFSSAHTAPSQSSGSGGGFSGGGFSGGGGGGGSSGSW